MKMVILGAGASYDSIVTPEIFHKYDKLNWRPPLGDQLFEFRPYFDKILKKYPGAESMRSEVNLCKDIEELFQNKYNLSQGKNGIGLLLKIINVQFYLQELFRNISMEYVDFGPSNYEILVSHANDYFLRTEKEVLFVTFNYDTLLEKSIEKLYNIKFKCESDYINLPLKVIKPHGSSNWFKKVQIYDDLIISLIRKKGLSNYMYDTIEANIQIINALDNNLFISDVPLDNLESDGKHLLFPQILIPLKTKDEFIMPDIHLKYLEAYLGKVDEILVIGWKANEIYFHDFIKERIKFKLVKVMTVCKQESGTINSKLKDIAENVEFIEFDDLSHYKGNQIVRGTFSAFSQHLNGSSKFDFFKE